MPSTKSLFFLISGLLMLLVSVTVTAKTTIPTAKTPAFMVADFVEYNATEEFIYARGNIKITMDNYLLTADKILYDINNDLLWAEGNVKIQDDKKQVIYGTTVFFKDKLKAGLIADFVFKFSDNTVLAAKLAEKVNTQQTILANTCFTPCNIPSSGKPIWQISAQQTIIDLDHQIISYKNLFFEVYKIPVFYTPYFSHPTPHARAQSGILVPEIKGNKLGIPLYFRAKPNMDFTLTPRLANKYNLFELEARHKINNGSYSISGSYGKIPYNIRDQGKIIKNSNVNRYHLFALGAFSQDRYQYGFDLKRTSDKAYLRNYFEMHDAYLASKLYLNNIHNNNYFSVEGLHFYGLKVDDSKSTDPLILPKIRTKNIINLNDNEDLQLIINNNTSMYQQPGGKQLTRSALGITATNQIITSDGHLFNTNLQTRGDAYFIKNMPIPNSTTNNSSYNKTHVRHIPELQVTWRMPLMSHFALSPYRLSIEPIISTTIGRDFQSKDHKFTFIDNNRYELSENNLFLANRYSGLDYHEFGKRISYGVNTTLLKDTNYFNIFLGQLLHKHNFTNTENAQNVGRLGININNAELFYRFRKNKKFEAIMEEVGSRFYNDKIQYTLSFIKLNNLKKYYLVDNKQLSTNINNIKQAHSDIQYQLTPSWLIGYEIQVDISTRKPQLLYKSIKVTYAFDCVSITCRLYDDYTSDYSRGITKVRSKTISLGLKVLNM